MKLKNLLIDSEFKNLDNQTWLLDNIENKEIIKKELTIISNNKVFGIHQKFFSKKSRYYFNMQINAETFIEEILIGYKKGKELYVNNATPFTYNTKQVSVIFDINEECEIDLYIIFKAKVKTNKVRISKPLLIDLNNIYKKTFTKKLLDQELKYVKSITYRNELNLNNSLNNWKTIGNNIIINKDIEIATLSIVKLKLIKNVEPYSRYAFKFEFISNNAYSEAIININGMNYNINTGNGLTNEQIIFKSISNELRVEFILRNDEITPEIPAIFMIKRLMLIDLDKWKLDENIIKDIPYIGK